MTKSTATDARRDILTLKVEQRDGIYQLDNYQICDSIGYLLKRSYNLLSAAIDQELAPYDLTYPQFSILMLLKKDNCSTAAELARETRNDTGAVTRMLDRLEAKDYLVRTRCSDDRRVVRITLTDPGRLVVEKMPIIAINVLNRHLQHFAADEVATLKNLLRKLLDQPGGAAATATDKENPA